MAMTIEKGNLEIHSVEGLGTLGHCVFQRQHVVMQLLDGFIREW
jgi:hypothetical protein